MSTFTGFLVIIGLVVIERLLELVLTRRHTRKLLARGGKILGQRHYPFMVALHASLLAVAPLEAWWFDRPFLPWLGWPALALVGLSMMLRYWAIVSLGERWTTTVVVVPGETAIRRGPYQFFRHPNYVAVIIEVIALPLIHTAWWTALVYGSLNLLVLRARIRVEEAALREYADWQRVMTGVPSFPTGNTPE
ncbi:MAG: isoprenylcysteine carboxylmethyltransferase family protein [Acidobacteriota bacterium]